MITIEDAQAALTNARTLREQQRTTESLKALEEAVLLAFKAGAPHIQAEAELQLGESIYRLDGREAESLVHLHRAVSLAPGTNLEALAWLTIGDVHQFLKDAETALGAFSESASIFKSLEDQRGEFLAMEGLANLLLELGRSKEALPVLERAGYLGLLEEEFAKAAELLLAIGEILMALDRRDEAARPLGAAAELFKEMGETQLEARARGHLFALSGGKDLAQMIRGAELFAEHAARSGDTEMEALANWGLGHILALQNSEDKNKHGA